VTLLAMAAILVALTILLLGPLSRWLADATWVTRAPRCAVVLWQAIGLSAIASGIGAGLAVAVYRYHTGFVLGVGKLAEGLLGGHPLRGLGLPDALGLTLAADLLIVLIILFGSLTARTIRSRARHRRLLNLVARRSTKYPGTDLIEDARPVAYCLPGRRPRIVISRGALRLLSAAQAHAVIEHERGHAHERHGLVMLPMVGLQRLFAWVPYARLAPLEIAILLEMSADDYSARRNDPVRLAAALVRMATSGHVPACALGAAGHATSRRVSRLLAESRTSKRTAMASVLLACAIVSTPWVTMLLT
jgi:Zn-dependent protease with chaperone function